MQLVAYGAQDIYLTGNPQITFFKVVYRRHTNFAMESVEQTLNGTASFGSSVTSTISRNGDLVHKMWVECDPSTILTLDNSNVYCPNPIQSLIQEVECEIGGQRIDRHYGHWLNVWAELTQGVYPAIIGSDGKYRVSDLCKADGAELVRAPNAWQRLTMSVKHDGTSAQDCEEAYACVPLQFWFCRNPGLALPLIALQYHEVKIKLTFAAETSILSAANSSQASLSSVKLWADYIYLDTDERRRFAQVSHEYLIEQLQYQSFSSGSSFKLNFNHPVKELIWTGEGPSSAGVHSGPNLPHNIQQNSDGTTDVEDTANGTCTFQLKLNGHDRFAARDCRYFTRNQPYTYHPNFNGNTSKGDSVYVYSFALKPEEHQPSGTCNFSRIDNAQLESNIAVCGATQNTTGIRVYAVNYNVLRIMSGMGGLAYSN